MIDYAAILAAQQNVDPIVTRTAEGIRLLLAQRFDPVILGHPTNAPDSFTGVVPYPIEDSLYGDVILGIQVRIRGGKNMGPKPVLERSEQILNILQQLTNVEIADGITVVVCWRNSSTPIVFDSVQRPEVFDSYYLRTDRPAFL